MSQEEKKGVITLTELLLGHSEASQAIWLIESSKRPGDRIIEKTLEIRTDLLSLKIADLSAWRDSFSTTRSRQHKNQSTRQQTCTWCVEGQPKYSGESHSNRRILMRDKWSYCALLKALGKPEGSDSHCRGEHLTGLLGGAEKYLSPFLSSIFFTGTRSHFFKITVCLCPLVLPVSLCLFPPPSWGLCHIYHLVRPALSALHSSFHPCYSYWFNGPSRARHTVNLCNYMFG